MTGMTSHVSTVKSTGPLSEVEGEDSNAVDWNLSRRLGSSWLRGIRVFVPLFSPVQNSIVVMW